MLLDINIEIYRTCTHCSQARTHSQRYMGCQTERKRQRCTTTKGDTHTQCIHYHTYCQTERKRQRFTNTKGDTHTQCIHYHTYIIYAHNPVTAATNQLFLLFWYQVYNWQIILLWQPYRNCNWKFPICVSRLCNWYIPIFATLVCLIPFHLPISMMGAQKRHSSWPPLGVGSTAGPMMTKFDPRIYTCPTPKVFGSYVWWCSGPLRPKVCCLFIEWLSSGRKAYLLQTYKRLI